MTSYHDRVAAAKAVITEVAPTEARRRVAAGGVLVDVREPVEIAQVAVEGAVAVPMRSVLDQVGALIPDTTTDVLVLCAAGNRSETVGSTASKRASASASIAWSIGRSLVLNSASNRSARTASTAWGHRRVTRMRAFFILSSVPCAAQQT